jgi:hypothetical protein
MRANCIDTSDMAFTHHDGSSADQWEAVCANKIEAAEVDGLFLFEPHNWPMVRYFDPGRYSTRGSIMRPEYASRLRAVK